MLCLGQAAGVDGVGTGVKGQDARPALTFLGGGTGQAIQQDKATVRIPDGTPLRLAGRGMPSPVPGGPPGDTYVIIRTLPDPQFARDRADLWHTLHIGIPDAVLGTGATAPAPDGQARLPVPPGTQSGAVLAIEVQGLPGTANSPSSRNQPRSW